jgi:LPXTG-site transpeptidase (sortase) family protein
VTPAAAGNLANTAVVDPDEVMPESNENNNTASNTVAVTVPGGPTADLSVVKTNGQIIYRPGSVVTYTVTVTNLNGDPADGATVTDNKPANITTWAWVCTTQSGGATGCDPAADSANNFTDTVNLPVGGIIVYTVTANVSANATGSLENTANIAVPEGITDPDPSNNSSTDRDELKAADLLLIKAPATKKVEIGDTLTFTLTLTNLGPNDAFDVEVTDKLPSAFTYISSIPSKGTYDSATGIWAVGDMPLNAEETLQMSVTVNGADTNVAEVTQSLDGPGGLPLVDPNPDNNLDESKITIKKDDDPTPKPNPYIIPVTGFQQGVVTDLSRVPHEVYLATADVTVEIPSLGVKIPIVGVPKKDGTWNVAWLENQAGWLEGSAFPSWNGNSVLTSHVYLASGKPGPFINLNKLKFGDKIVVHAYGQKYTFEVQTNTVVPPTDKSMMKHEEKPWLTLVTCKDYDPKTNTYLNRILVRARLVSVDWE